MLIHSHTESHTQIQPYTHFYSHINIITQILHTLSCSHTHIYTLTLIYIYSFAHNCRILMYPVHSSALTHSYTHSHLHTHIDSHRLTLRHTLPHAWTCSWTHIHKITLHMPTHSYILTTQTHPDTHPPSHRLTHTHKHFPLYTSLCSCCWFLFILSYGVLEMIPRQEIFFEGEVLTM